MSALELCARSPEDGTQSVEARPIWAFNSARRLSGWSCSSQIQGSTLRHTPTILSDHNSTLILPKKQKSPPGVSSPSHPPSPNLDSEIPSPPLPTFPTWPALPARPQVNISSSLGPLHPQEVLSTGQLLLFLIHAPSHSVHHSAFCHDNILSH